MARTVVSTTGEEWEIGLERPALLPRWRGSVRAGAESLDAGGWAMELAEIPAIGIVFLVIGLAIIALSVIGFILLPVILFAIELVVLLVGAVVVVAYRWLRRAHVVVARTGSTEMRWRVTSMSDAREVIDSAVASLEAGSLQPAPTAGELIA